MSPKLATLMRAEPPSSYAEVLAHLTRTVGASHRASCLNPLCATGAAVVWGRGRPQLFCSDSCRHAFDHERRRLLDEVELLEKALGSLGGTVRDGRALQGALAQRRWLLLRYPDLPQASARKPPAAAATPGRRAGRR